MKARQERRRTRVRGPEQDLFRPPLLDHLAGIHDEDLVCDVAQSGLFTYMLTPNYNQAHHDHLHVDIKRDAKRTVIR